MCIFVSTKFAILEDEIPEGQTVLIKFRNPALDYQRGEMKEGRFPKESQVLRFPWLTYKMRSCSVFWNSLLDSWLQAFVHHMWIMNTQR